MKLRRVTAVILLVGISGCASHYGGDHAPDPYGLFSGIWHGFVSPLSALTNLFSWVASIFGLSLLQDIQIVGQPNTGFFYYAGFVFGLIFFLRGAGER